MARLIDLPSLLAAEERFCASDSIDGGGPSSHQWLDPSPSHAPQATTYCKLGSWCLLCCDLEYSVVALGLDKRSSGEFWSKCSDSKIEELVACCLRQQKKHRERNGAGGRRRNQEREEREGGIKRFPTDRYGPHVRENIGSEFLVICFNSVSKKCKICYWGGREKLFW